MDCEYCKAELKSDDVFYDDNYDCLCETCFYELEEAKDIELVKLQKQYHKEIS